VLNTRFNLGWTSRKMSARGCPHWLLASLFRFQGATGRHVPLASVSVAARTVLGELTEGCWCRVPVRHGQPGLLTISVGFLGVKVTVEQRHVHLLPPTSATVGQSPAGRQSGVIPLDRPVGPHRRRGCEPRRRAGLSRRVPR